MTARVVVLGGTGFVGARLRATLSAFDLDVAPVSSRDVDLRDPRSPDALRTVLAGADAIVVCAALTPDRGRDLATLMANLTMVEHLCTALADVRPSHVVYVSSDAVYADTEDPITGSSCPQPATPHGVMHLAREHFLSLAVRDTETRLLVLRPCALYGSGDTHNSYGPNRFVRTALGDHKITLLGGGEDRRDHVFVDDLCHVIGLGILAQTAGTLNVASGRSVSFAQLAGLVREAVGEQVAIEHAPRSAAVTHRDVDVADLASAFPTLRLTPLDQGLLSMVRELRGSGGRPA